MFSDESSLDSPEELRAVNDILAAIGETAVNSFEGGMSADVSNARRILNNVNREIQARGWTFNISEGEELLPDANSGLIMYMADFLKVTTPGGATPYIRRGEYLYDRLNKTDVFTGPVSVDLIRLKSYTEMPECFRSLIVCKASRRFNIFFFGAGEVEGHLAEQETEFYRACMEYEMDFGAYNMLDGDAYVNTLTR